MVDRFATRIETAANIGIVIVAALGAALLVKQLVTPAQAGPRPVARAAAGASETASRAPAPGAAIDLAGVDWKKNDQTLVLVLSTTCRFCTNSAPFYRRITAEALRTGKTRLIAVLTQPTADATRYLADMGIAVDEVLQAAPSAIGTRGTPTLLLVDRQGRVKHTWTGQLPSAREAEVLGSL